MSRMIHYETEIKVDIYADMDKVASELITDKLRNMWPDTYLSDLDINDYIELVVGTWIENYINSDITKEVIGKLKSDNPPRDLKIYLVFNLFDSDDGLIIDRSEIRTVPLFRVYLPTGERKRL